MSYFPLLKAPGCQGRTTLFNFAPNNWETSEGEDKVVSVTWIKDSSWHSRSIGTLKRGETRTVNHSDLEDVVSNGALPLLSLSRTALPIDSDVLPTLDDSRTILPAWRATLGLATKTSVVSYQGEIDPFPGSGSLMTFNSFMQFGENIENYLLIVNIEKSPVIRTTQIEIYNPKTMELLVTTEAGSNNVSVVSLDNIGIKPTDLPLVICREMSGIPLYFSKTTDGSYLSLEHTHPPASYVVHGKRWEAQKELKQKWFSRLASL